MRIHACWLVLAAGLTLAGCGWLPDAYSGCEEVRPYQSARSIEPLRVPAGADMPDTSSSLEIPEVKAPELPTEPGRCLEHPPPYGTTTQTSPQQPPSG
jgi:uncharacterized lipoprotein